MIATSKEQGEILHRENMNQQWQRNLDLYVKEQILSKSKFRQKNGTNIVKEKKYRQFDDINKAICQKVMHGHISDTVSWERLQNTNACAPKRKMNYFNNDGMNLNVLLNDTSCSEQMVFSENAAFEESLDDITKEFDRDIATIETHENILLSVRKYEIGIMDKRATLIKYFSYVSYCNASGTIIALLNIYNLIDFNAETVLGLEQSNGIAILLNLLSSEFVIVQKAALNNLIKLCQVIYFSRIVVGLGGLSTLSNLIAKGVDDVKVMVAELMSHIASLKETRIIAYRTHIIIELVCLLGKLVPDLKQITTILDVKTTDNSETNNYKMLLVDYIEVTHTISCIIETMVKLATHPPNIERMRQAGTIPLLINLIKSEDFKILIPTFKLFSICIKEEIYRKAIITDNFLLVFVKACKRDKLLIRLYAASVVGNCMVDPEARAQLMQINDFIDLFKIMQDEVEIIRKIIAGPWLYEPIPILKFSANIATGIFMGGKHELAFKSPSYAVRLDNRAKVIHPEDSEGTHFKLLRSVLYALQQFMCDMQVVNKLVEFGFTQILIEMISILTPIVMTYVQPNCGVSPTLVKLRKVEATTAGILRCLERIHESSAAQVIVNDSSDIVENLLKLLSIWTSPIMEPCLETITALACNSKTLQKMLQGQVLRITLSLCCHKVTTIQTAAFRASTRIINKSPSKMVVLKPIASSLKTIGDRIRDGIEIFRTSSDSKIKTQYEKMLEWAFWLIAEVGQIEKYRTIMTDYGIAKHLVSYISIVESVDCQVSLLNALQNIPEGLLQCIKYLTEFDLVRLFHFLNPPNQALQQSTCHVIANLDNHPVTSKRLSELGISKLLIQMLSSGIKELQLAAAITISQMNLRFTRKNIEETYIQGQQNDQVTISSTNSSVYAEEAEEELSKPSTTIPHRRYQQKFKT